MSKKLKKVQNAYLIGLAAVCLLHIAGCSNGLDSKAWPYPIIDSGFSVLDKGEVYWLDDNRVLFQGHEGGKPKTAEERNNLKWGLFIWNIEANEVTPYHVPAKRLCYHDGFIHYVTKDSDGNKVLRKGQMGSEKDYPYSEFYYPTEERDHKKRNKFSCKLSERPALLDGRGWLPLLKQHGDLDTGYSRKNPEKIVNFKIYPKSSGVGIELPIVTHCVGNIKYLDFNNRYYVGCFFVVNQSKPETEQECSKTWEFTPEGKVFFQCLPFKEKLGRSGSLYPIMTKKGPVVISHSMTRTPPGQAGIYLYKEGDYQRLIAGYTKAHGLSPSGCKLAFDHKIKTDDTRLGFPGKPTLKMIDLCVNGGN